MSLAAWLNTAWMLKCWPEAMAFQRATRHVEVTQACVLAEILRQNRQTEFGDRHGFKSIRHPRQFQARVPLSTYQEYQVPIERIAVGERNVLTCDPVELLEPTSGTTQGEKLIPYTESLRRQFQRGVAAWIANLFRERPGVRRGRAYWSISAALPSRRSTGGIRIGFDDDAAYLGTLERRALVRLLVAPPLLARIQDIQAFRYCTLRFLLAAEDLALISIWNPTFFTALLVSLDEWSDRLCFDLRRGRLSPPAELSGNLARRLRCVLSPNGRRAIRLASILRAPQSTASKLREIWPRLALISCWADAAAARALGGLCELFPAVEIQPKGLLATEGFVSFPLVGRPGAALALRCHFFEFEPAAGGSPRMAHELDMGGLYRVILTTGGGLYRYQLHDEVEVVGFENDCPLLRFRGKADRVTDLGGEKLAEPHVRRTLDRLFTAWGVAPHFAQLTAIQEGRPHYALFLQGSDLGSSAQLLEGWAAQLESALQENPHYRYATGLGQLAPAAVHVLDPDGESAWSIYERRCLARGQRAGSIKPAALDGWAGWPREFAPLIHASFVPNGSNTTGSQPAPGRNQ